MDSVHFLQVLVPILLGWNEPCHIGVPMLFQDIRKPAGRLNAALVIVGAKIYSFKLRMVFQSRQHRTLIYSVHSDIAVLLPVLRVQRYKRQHIYRSLKDIQPVAYSEMRKAVPSIRACNRYPERLSEGNR